MLNVLNLLVISVVRCKKGLPVALAMSKGNDFPSLEGFVQKKKGRCRPPKDGKKQSTNNKENKGLGDIVQYFKKNEAMVNVVKSPAQATVKSGSLILL
ncbi:hypothetical protein V6N13_099377 [Hibiscus sabdariffa]